jgi:sigma-B regulation protein RsbU (phosphoserine phosphatase)
MYERSVTIKTNIVVLGEYCDETLMLEDYFDDKNYSYYKFDFIASLKKIPKFRIDIIILLSSYLIDNQTINDIITLKKEYMSEILIILKNKDERVINILFDNGFDNYIIFPLIKGEIKKVVLRLTKFKERAAIIDQLLDIMNYSVVITDRDKRIVYVNNEFCRETGYSKYELIGNEASCLKSDEQNYMFYDNLIETLKAELVWKGMFHNIRKNNVLYWDNASIYPIKIHGEVKYYVKIGNNITDKEKVVNDSKKRNSIARKIQNKLLSNNLLDNSISIKGVYYPLKNISGNVYKWFKYSDEKYVVFLGDVVGNEVGRALLTTAIIETFLSIINENNDLKNVMKILNNRVIDILSGDSELEESCLTAVYLIIDTNLKTIEYYNCGHLPIYLIKNNKVEKLISVNKKIGLFKDIDFKSDIINYESDSEILLYTDGIIEISTEFTDPVELLENTLKLYSNSNYNLLDLIESEILEHYFNKIKDDISLISIKLF